MDKIKIIFFDIDGTLVDPETGNISQRTMDTLRRLKQRGFLLCIATGRPNMCLPDFGDFRFDAFCAFNGADCYTGEKIIFSAPISPKTVDQVMENAAGLGRPVSLALRDRLVANGVEKDLGDYYALSHLVLTVAEDFEEARRQPIYQIMLGCREEDFPAIVHNAPDVKIAVSWDRAVDVVSTEGGKGNGVKKIVEYFGLDISEALAFGDSRNDLEMIEAVGTGVAMGNAAELLKRVADEVCGPVSEDGIYHYCLARGWL